MLARIAVLATLGPAGLAFAQKTTYQTSDFLPLQVGNSWTYNQFYSDVRYGDDGIRAHVVEVREEFTISILRTEVIDGNTYFVFSDFPSDGGPPAPRHFIAGKKVRWNENDLMEHDGTSEFSIYRFKPPPTGQTAYEYSIPVAHGKGDNLVRGFNSPSHNIVPIPRLQFTFTGYRGYGASPTGGRSDWLADSSIQFTGGYGVTQGLEGLHQSDELFLKNIVSALRATLYGSSSDSGTRNDSTEPPTTIEWESLLCIIRRLCEDTTSLPSSTWGQTKSSIR
ncbi:MAG: hypothetical protein OXH89_05965 [bacterium]|nr:hypothetical protein [bacterium]